MTSPIPLDQNAQWRAARMLLPERVRLAGAASLYEAAARQHREAQSELLYELSSIVSLVDLQAMKDSPEGLLSLAQQAIECR